MGETVSKYSNIITNYFDEESKPNESRTNRRYKSRKRSKRRRIVSLMEMKKNIVGRKTFSFRLDIIDMFTPSMWRSGLYVYISKFPFPNRQIFNEPKIYHERISRMSEIQKCQELSTFGHQEFMLKNLLNRKTLHDLNFVHKKHFPDEYSGKRGVSKMILIDVIIDKYFGRIGDIQSRKLEEENISTSSDASDNMNDYRFISMMCNHYVVPQEIILEVFSYLVYDSKLLFQIGKTCKTFYLLILSSWPSLTIRKGMTFKISLLVLKGLRTVTFQVSQDKPNETFRNDELEFILKNLNPRRLEKIIIHSRVFSYFKIMTYLMKRALNNKTTVASFTNVRSITYLPQKIMFNDRYQYACRKKDQDVYGYQSHAFHSLSNIFPRLQSFSNPLDFAILEGLKLRNLQLDLSVPYEFSRRGVPCRFRVLGGFREGKINKLTITSLSIIFHPNDRSIIRRLQRFLKGFVKLENLKIVLRKTDKDYHDKVFENNYRYRLDLNKIHPVNLLKFEVVEQKVWEDPYDEIEILRYWVKGVPFKDDTFQEPRLKSLRYRYDKYNIFYNKKTPILSQTNFHTIDIPNRFIMFEDFKFCLLNFPKLEELEVCVLIRDSSEENDVNFFMEFVRGQLFNQLKKYVHISFFFRRFRDVLALKKHSDYFDIAMMKSTSRNNIDNSAMVRQKLVHVSPFIKEFFTHIPTILMNHINTIGNENNDNYYFDSKKKESLKIVNFDDQCDGYITIKDHLHVGYFTHVSKDVSREGFVKEMKKVGFRCVEEKSKYGYFGNISDSFQFLYVGYDESDNYNQDTSEDDIDENKCVVM